MLVGVARCCSPSAGCCEAVEGFTAESTTGAADCLCYQDVYDRLAPLGIDASTRRVTRVLMDFTAEPDKRACSMLLWRLNWLTQGTRVARPIMGELKLGMEPRQESWDVALHGAEQRAVIQLAFEGVTVEQVLEKRLSADAFGVDARTLTALRAVEGTVHKHDQLA